MSTAPDDSSAPPHPALATARADSAPAPDPAGVVIAAIAAGLVLFIGISALTRALSGNNADFLCFFEGARAMAEGRNPYAIRVFKDFGYIYPPLLGVVLMPLVPLGAKAASVVWLVLMWALLPLTALLTAHEFSKRLTALGDAPWARATVASVAGLGLLVVFDKMHHEIRMGNCNLLTVLAFVLALRWLGPRPILAGLVLGVAANIKYLPVVVLPYLLVRGHFRASAGMVVGAVAGALLPALVLGWDLNLQYLGTAFGAVGELSTTTTQLAEGPPVYPVTWKYSVSITSALSRAIGTGPGLWLTVGVVALGMLGVGWALYRAHGIPLLKGRGRARDFASPGLHLMVNIEWLGLLAAALVFSPQSASRHFNMALPLAVGAIALVVAGSKGGSLAKRGRWLALAGAVVFALSLILPPGEGALHAFVQPWRDVAGISLGLLAMLFAVVWRGLVLARGADTAMNADGPSAVVPPGPGSTGQVPSP